MRVGDLVKPKPEYSNYVPSYRSNDEEWVGIILRFAGSEPIVYWNERFSEEIEYPHQLEVVG